MFTHGGLGKSTTGKIIVFSRGRITVDGVEISKEEDDRLREDGRRKLLSALAIRQEYRMREDALKKEKDALSKNVGSNIRQDFENLKRKP